MKIKTMIATLASALLLGFSLPALAQDPIPKEENENGVKKETPATDGDVLVLTDGDYLILVMDAAGHIVQDFSGYYPAGSRIPLSSIPGDNQNRRIFIKKTDPAMETMRRRLD